jgi:hypothetical protein
MLGAWMPRPILWAIAFLALQISGGGLMILGMHLLGATVWWKEAMVIAIASLCLWLANRIKENNS